MAEKDTVFSSKIKLNGIFSFATFYKFCYDWLKEETGLDLVEKKYAEKISGNAKNIDVEWEGSRKFTDYFKFQAVVKFQVIGLEQAEMVQDGKKIKTNKGSVEVSIKGTLIRDYEGKFETTPGKKFMRSIYEKWIIPSRIDEFEEKIIKNCDEFLSQAKAYLDIEGKA